MGASYQLKALFHIVYVMFVKTCVAYLIHKLYNYPPPYKLISYIPYVKE